MSSRLQGVLKKLEHNMRRDKVGHLLEKRYDIQQIQERSILKGMCAYVRLCMVCVVVYTCVKRFICSFLVSFVL